MWRMYSIHVYIAMQINCRRGRLYALHPGIAGPRALDKRNREFIDGLFSLEKDGVAGLSGRGRGKENARGGKSGGDTASFVI